MINLEKTMEDFDWEALFASLDATTQANGTQAGDQTSPLPENSTNHEAAIDDVAPSVTEPVGDQMLEIAPAQSISSPVHEAFERGMQIVHNEGNLSLAVHAFQEASRADPAHFEAWKMLGSVLAEVEREAEAILAFDEALKLEPDNLDVLMRLAVSHTNEGSQEMACECLERWIKITYPQISIPKLDPQAALASRSDLFERIKDPFIRAARLSLEEEDIDPDVQIGLGVLMFSANLYDMAADCFYAAIQSTNPGSTKHQTQLHLLWNRYAACLGNVRDKENMAIEAYQTALALKPNFVKARCNLGVLYHNINQPLLGARNFLDTIISRRTIYSTTKDQTTDGPMDNDEMTEMYDMLMRCCSSMCRWDLAELVGPDMDLKRFKTELDSC
jgi:peroxin-5